MVVSGPRESRLGGLCLFCAVNLINTGACLLPSLGALTAKWATLHYIRTCNRVDTTGPFEAEIPDGCGSVI